MITGFCCRYHEEISCLATKDGTDNRMRFSKFQLTPCSCRCGQGHRTNQIIGAFQYLFRRRKHKSVQLLRIANKKSTVTLYPPVIVSIVKLLKLLFCLWKMYWLTCLEFKNFKLLFWGKTFLFWRRFWEGNSETTEIVWNNSRLMFGWGTHYLRYFSHYAAKIFFKTLRTCTQAYKSGNCQQRFLRIPQYCKLAQGQCTSCLKYKLRHKRNKLFFQILLWPLSVST